MIINQSRRKIGYTYSSVSGSFSFRGEKSIEFESTLERDMLRIFEYDLHVIEVIEQPLTIPYVNDNGNEASYTPDFLIHFDNKPSWLVEVKPYNILTKKFKELRPKLKIGFRHAKDMGWVFHVYHDLKIRTDYLERIFFLARYKRIQISNSETNRILNHLNIKEHDIIQNIIIELYPDKNNHILALNHVWHLLSVRTIWCDLTKELNKDTTCVWLK